MQQKNILSTARLFCLNIGCWHHILEHEYGNPYELHHIDLTYGGDDGLSYTNVDIRSRTCDGHCPRCDGTMDIIVKPINRIGIKHFLVDAFGDKYNGLVYPLTLAKQLFDFDNVGELACKRKKVRKLNQYL